MSLTVLIVEDDVGIADMLSLILKASGYDVTVATQVDQAWQIMSLACPDLILLDWMLPGQSGFMLLKKCRSHKHFFSVPIVMMTARSQEDDLIEALEAGADDYIIKPISPRQLLARMQAVIRRRLPQYSTQKIYVQDLEIDPDRQCVTYRERSLVLGAIEFRLLTLLATHPDRVYSRAQLLDMVWGARSALGERTVDVYVRRLRVVLAEVALDHLVQTVRGTGYRLSIHPDS